MEFLHFLLSPVSSFICVLYTRSAVEFSSKKNSPSLQIYNTLLGQV